MACKVKKSGSESRNLMTGRGLCKGRELPNLLMACQSIEAHIRTVRASRKSDQSNEKGSKMGDIPRIKVMIRIRWSVHSIGPILQAGLGFLLITSIDRRFPLIDLHFHLALLVLSAMSRSVVVSFIR